MNRAQALAKLNGRILCAYSARTVAALREVLPLRLVLPGLEPVLALNVEKEVRKDAQVIRCAAEAVQAGTVPGTELVQELVAATQAIDREFLARVQRFPVRLSIRYEAIVLPRTKRIERLLEAAYRILTAWNGQRRLRLALRACFTETDFEQLMKDLLQLYAVETRALSASVRLPSLLTPLREELAQRLFATMSTVALQLSAELVRAVYHRPARPPGWSNGGHAG